MSYTIVLNNHVDQSLKNKILISKIKNIKREIIKLNLKIYRELVYNKFKTNKDKNKM